MANTRSNCERIREIEAAIEPLLKELVELVKPTEEELGELEDELRDMSRDIEGYGDEPWLCIMVLDSREIREEEYANESEEIE
jgi:hypothetical protein